MNFIFVLRLPVSILIRNLSILPFRLFCIFLRHIRNLCHITPPSGFFPLNIQYRTAFVHVFPGSNITKKNRI